MRILVVEDDPRLGPSLKKGLEKHHYAVDLVDNGEDAVLIATATPYDLLVLDVLLPRLNGFEVCHQLRNHRRTMPILLLTALGEVDHRVTHELRNEVKEELIRALWLCGWWKTSF